MNIRLMLGKDALEKGLNDLGKILDAYVFMLAPKDELQAQLQDKKMKEEHDSLKKHYLFLN